MRRCQKKVNNVFKKIFDKRFNSRYTLNLYNIGGSYTMATQTLTVQDRELVVSELPVNIQRTVSLYDEAVDRARKAETELVINGSASKYFLEEITRLVDAHLASENSDTEEVSESVEPEEESEEVSE